MISSSLLLTVLASTISSVAANCNLKSSTSLLVENGEKTFDDVDKLDGMHIDKITKVEVYSGNYGIHHIVTKLITTYKLKNGESRPITNGNGGDLFGSYSFAGGVYLKSVHFSAGNWVAWINFCDTNDNCSNMFGWLKDKPENNGLQKDRSVVKAFLGQDGAVIDRVRVHWETNQLYSVEMQSPGYFKLIIATISDESLPNAQQIEDNREGDVEQFFVLTFKEEIGTEETTTITETHEFDVEVSVSASAGVDFKVISAGAESTFSAGSSWASSLEQKQKKSLTKTIQKEFRIVAPPRTLTRADIYFNKVHYEYSWIAPTICTYTFAPNKQVTCDSFEGTMKDLQPFEQVKVVYSYEGVPTNTPLPRPTVVPTENEPFTFTPATPSTQNVPTPSNTVTARSLNCLSKRGEMCVRWPAVCFRAVCLRHQTHKFKCNVQVYHCSVFSLQSSHFTWAERWNVKDQ